MIVDEGDEPTLPAAEFFYLDVLGQPQDAELHAGMLDNREADEKQRQGAMRRQLAAGLTCEEVELLFGPLRRI